MARITAYEAWLPRSGSRNAVGVEPTPATLFEVVGLAHSHSIDCGCVTSLQTLPAQRCHAVFTLHGSNNAHNTICMDAPDRE